MSLRNYSQTTEAIANRCQKAQDGSHNTLHYHRGNIVKRAVCRNLVGYIDIIIPTPEPEARTPELLVDSGEGEKLGSTGLQTFCNT